MMRGLVETAMREENIKEKEWEERLMKEKRQGAEKLGRELGRLVTLATLAKVYRS